MYEKALIFDFDGTLADSCYVWKKVDERFFGKRGMDVPSDYFDKISTLSFYNGAVFTKQSYGIKESVEEIMAEWDNDVIDEYRHNVRLKKGAKEYLCAAKKCGYKVGLATATNPQYYNPVLDRYGLNDFFDAYADGCDDVRGKDYPDIYLLCAKRLGVKPENCTVYEDVTKCIKTAQKAGMRTVAVYDRHNPTWDEAKSIADEYMESLTVSSARYFG